jgi:hypothetical protein
VCVFFFSFSFLFCIPLYDSDAAHDVLHLFYSNNVEKSEKDFTFFAIEATSK